MIQPKAKAVLHAAAACCPLCAAVLTHHGSCAQLLDLIKATNEAGAAGINVMDELQVRMQCVYVFTLVVWRCCAPRLLVLMCSARTRGADAVHRVPAVG